MNYSNNILMSNSKLPAQTLFNKCLVVKGYNTDQLPLAPIFERGGRKG